MYYHMYKITKKNIYYKKWIVNIKTQDKKQLKLKIGIIVF